MLMSHHFRRETSDYNSPKPTSKECRRMDHFPTQTCANWTIRTRTHQVLSPRGLFGKILNVLRIENSAQGTTKKSLKGKSHHWQSQGKLMTDSEVLVISFHKYQMAKPATWLRSSFQKYRHLAQACPIPQHEYLCRSKETTTFGPFSSSSFLWYQRMSNTSGKSKEVIQ